MELSSFEGNEKSSSQDVISRDTERIQAAPPPPPASGMPAQQIPNYLIPSILVTICCCLPLGIPAIIFAAQVNAKIQAGDYAGAQESSRKAKMWFLVALSAGIVAMIVSAILSAVTGLLSNL